MHLSLDGFVAGPSRYLSGEEMNRMKVDEEIFDHVGKPISLDDTAYGSSRLPILLSKVLFL